MLCEEGVPTVGNGRVQRVIQVMTSTPCTPCDEASEGISSLKWTSASTVSLFDGVSGSVFGSLGRGER